MLHLSGYILEQYLCLHKGWRLSDRHNVAERAVHPFTTQRNSMLHLGSDEGAKMAATYHSIISTVKMQGRPKWDYLGIFLLISLMVAGLFQSATRQNRIGNMLIVNE
jgi:hypothetical protein